MPSTIAELVLSPAYRHAQRSLAAWLGQGHGMARRHVFRARTALAALDASERHRMARWLAWLSIATRSQGVKDLGTRVRRLDDALYRMMEDAAGRLPAVAVSGSRINDRLRA
jgi:hypothetical protein